MYSHPTYETRTKQLREAYAARRFPGKVPHSVAEHAVSLQEQYGIDRPAGDDSFFPTVLQLADLIATHSIHVAPYGAIVYARIGEREVGVEYTVTGGDKAKAVRLAVREVLRLVGVTV